MNSYCPSLLAGPLGSIQCPHRSTNTGMSMCRSPWKKIAYKSVCPSFLTLPTMSIMSCSSYLDVCEMGANSLYSCCYVECCFQDLFKTACSILVLFPSSFHSMHFVRVQLVHPCSCTDTTTAWKKSHFILCDLLQKKLHRLFILINEEKETFRFLAIYSSKAKNFHCLRKYYHRPSSLPFHYFTCVDSQEILYVSTVGNHGF